MPKSHQQLRQLWLWQQPLSAALLCLKLLPFPSQQGVQVQLCKSCGLLTAALGSPSDASLGNSWQKLTTHSCSTSQQTQHRAACSNVFFRAFLPHPRAGKSQGELPEQTAVGTPYSCLSWSHHGGLHIPLAQRCPEGAGTNADGFAALAREGKRLQESEIGR